MVPTYDMRRSMKRRKDPCNFLEDAKKEHIKKREDKALEKIISKLPRDMKKEDKEVEARKIRKKQHTNAGLYNERQLVKLLHRVWNLKARRLKRSGAGSEDKPADIRLTLDDSEDFLIEAKLRTECHGVYAIVHETDECHKIMYKENEYFFVSQETFRQLIVERIAPKIIENHRQGVKCYDDLFRETFNKEKTIDILALRQRTNGMKHVFIVRPKTMQKLLSRCERHET